MKDRQVSRPPPPLRIPIVSDILHCVAMTVIVFLRSSFGFAYLCPKGVFMVFSWAFALFFLCVWRDPEVWANWWLVCLYGLAAIGLYHAHLLIAFFRELYRRGEHDQNSGTPHFLRVLRWRNKKPSALFEMNWILWVEPIAVLLAGLILRFIFREQHLSTWLMCVAPCFCCKEALNFWIQLRHTKQIVDNRETTEDVFGAIEEKPSADAPKATGTEKVRRPRAITNSAADELKERQHAQVLRLMPPYTLEDAEVNYRKLIKQVHPDPNQATPENNALAAEMNEAIAYFRENPPKLPPSSQT